MTKREALRLCRKLWLWLAENPGKYKQASPQSLGISGLVHCCPCCEYVKQRGIWPGRMGKKGCVQLCPLKHLWPNGCEENGFSPQRGARSPWDRWRASCRTDTAAAREIADACIERRKR